MVDKKTITDSGRNLNQEFNEFYGQDYTVDQSVEKPQSEGEKHGNEVYRKLANMGKVEER